jgi:hypothetical protein
LKFYCSEPGYFVCLFNLLLVCLCLFVHLSLLIFLGFVVVVVTSFSIVN